MKKINFILLTLTSFLLQLSGFDINYFKKEHQPSWVYLRTAENLKEKGDYAQAIIHAKKARKSYINEKLAKYFEELREEHQDKTSYEILKIVDHKEEELKINDDYPAYHELLGDLYVLTDFLSEAEKEYQLALKQKAFLEYPDKILELKYKLADVYHRNHQYELEDLVYREIVEGYFAQKNIEYWNRMRYNIRKDQTLSHVFRIYRNEGIKYLKALYKIGFRSALLKRKDESLFYLANAAITWMTFNNDYVKQFYFDFQYAGPIDFINYITNKNVYEYYSDNDIMNEIMFYIGYNFYLNNEAEIMDHFFQLANKFSLTNEQREEMDDRIYYLLTHPGHMITYDEILD
ncbi:MAG: MC/SLC25 family protein [Spirochaetes bacterium]|nr:MC/SLC25 family protein [Spirochaetota bacterium]